MERDPAQPRSAGGRIEDSGAEVARPQRPTLWTLEEEIGRREIQGRCVLTLSFGRASLLLDCSPSPNILYGTVYANGCASVHYLSCRRPERCEVPDEGTRIRYEIEFLPPQQSAPARPIDSDFFVRVSG
jgi:hypothetical protein